MTPVSGNVIGPFDVVPYPPDVAERYRREGYWGGRPLADEIWRAFEEHAGRLALTTAEVRWTFGELRERCDQFAAGLLTVTGLRPGDPVMFSMGNVAETVVAFYGCVRAGLVPVCTLPMHGSREIGLLASHTGAKGIIAQADFRSRDLAGTARQIAAGSDTLTTVIVSRGLAPEGSTAFTDVLEAGARPEAQQTLADVIVDPDSVVAFQLSGGTTGLPKVAPRLHEEYAYNARQWAAALGWSPETVVLYPLPLMHNAGIVLALLPAHLSGATLVLAADADPGTILAALATERPTVLPLCPPAVAIRLLDDPRTRSTDLTCLQDVIVGGQRLPVETALRLERELGIRCRQMFGMAEGMFMLTPKDAGDRVRLHTVGAPLSPADEVRVYDIGTEVEVEDGREGELCARGPYTIRGYFRAPEHNNSTFTADGFYRTGDLSRRHVVGAVAYYSIDGRIKDVINRGVEKIHAEEVEELMVLHRDVLTAALVAMPDKVLGERACAYLVMEQGAEPLDVASLGTHLRAQGLSTYKLPERVEIVEALPLTNVGKVSKKNLRDQIAAKLAAEEGAQA